MVLPHVLITALSLPSIRCGVQQMEAQHPAYPADLPLFWCYKWTLLDTVSCHLLPANSPISFTSLYQAYQLLSPLFLCCFNLLSLSIWISSKKLSLVFLQVACHSLLTSCLWCIKVRTSSHVRFHCRLLPVVMNVISSALFRCLHLPAISSLFAWLHLGSTLCVNLHWYLTPESSETISKCVCCSKTRILAFPCCPIYRTVRLVGGRQVQAWHRCWLLRRLTLTMQLGIHI